MTKDTKMDLRVVVRRGSFIGSGALVGALVAVSTVFATCGSTCGGSASDDLAASAGVDGGAMSTKDSGAHRDVKESKPVDAGIAAFGEAEGSTPGPDVADSGQHKADLDASAGADVGLFVADGGRGLLDGAGFTGGATDASDAAPIPPNQTCLFNGLSCEGDASNACCTFCQNGACGGCFARGVQLPADGGLCCPGAGSVVTVGSVSYCGTDLCLADGVACGDAGGKPCCNGQCNGVVCGGV
jgi:hypothetical protein